jgi:hypothetical protein
MRTTLPLRSILSTFILLSIANNIIAQAADNLASGKPAFASSVRSAPPDSAFDGDATTRWESDYSDPQWIYVDLGNSYPIKRVHLLWDTAYALNYDLQVSDDAINWITVQSVTGNPSLDNDLTNLNANGRYVRLYATVRGNMSSADLYGYSLKEMEVYSHDNPPVISITSPQNNEQHLFTTTPTITATADATGMSGKEINKVELYSGTTLVAVDTDAPYTFSLASLSEGYHTLSAKAIDEANAVAYSQPVVLRLSMVTANPCSSPAWNNATIYSNIGTQVTYLGRLYKNRWYTVGQDPLNNSGAYKVWELVSTCSTPTTVNITHPEQNDSFHALASIDIHVDALATSPYRITKVDLYSGSTLIDSDTSSSFSFDWNDVGAGTYTLTAVATDNAGLSVTSDPKTIRVIAGTGCNAPEWRPNIVYSAIGEQITYQGSVYQNKWYTYNQNPSTNSGLYQVWTRISTCPATAAITTPGDSAMYTAPASITINATATNPAGSVVKVAFYQGASLLAVDSTAPYSFNWAGVAAGSYMLSVKAFDANGVIATSSSVNIIVKSLQNIYTWTGAAGNSNWNDPNNWSPNGIPGQNDSVTIATAASFPTLSTSVSVTDLTILSDSINLNGQQLTITGVARFTGGSISNGTLMVQCEEAWFGGTTFNSNLLLQTTCSNIYLNGGTFNGPSFITKQGSAALDNDGDGGNTFNGPLTLVNNTTFRLRAGNTLADNFNGAVIFNNNNIGAMDIGYNDNTSFAGNITINSNTEIGFGTGGGTIVLDSSNNQVIFKTGAANIIFNRLQVNKASGDVTLDDPLHINSSLTLTNGRIITASDDRLIFRPGATVTGASNASFVSGPVTKYGAGSFTFPVGKGNNYRPVSIAPAGTPGDAFTAEYFRAQGPDTSAREISIHHVSACEYWVVDRINGTAVTPVTLSWDNTSCGVNAPAELVVARWNGSIWVNEGNGGTTGNANAGTVSSIAPVISFSPFTLASTTANNVLPVQWLSFTAAKREKAVLLEWSTALEEQNKGFAIERSADGTRFEQIGFVNGAGNSSHVSNYSWEDNAPIAGTSYYRLKQIDNDGHWEYSKTVSVTFALTAPVVQLMPNPARTKTKLLLQLVRAEKCTITLTDLAGRTVYTEQLGEVISRTVDMDLSKFNTGMYLLTVRTPEKTIYQTKLIIQ